MLTVYGIETDQTPLTPVLALSIIVVSVPIVHDIETLEYIRRGLHSPL